MKEYCQMDPFSQMIIRFRLIVQDSMHSTKQWGNKQHKYDSLKS